LSYNFCLLLFTSHFQLYMGHLITKYLLLFLSSKNSSFSVVSHVLNTVTCRPITRERVDKYVSIEMDSWKPRRHFHGYTCSRGVSMDTDMLYNRKLRWECSQSYIRIESLVVQIELKEYNGVQQSSGVVKCSQKSRVSSWKRWECVR
jgi:hypothetical protein